MWEKKNQFDDEVKELSRFFFRILVIFMTFSEGPDFFQVHGIIQGKMLCFICLQRPSLSWATFWKPDKFC